MLWNSVIKMKKKTDKWINKSMNDGVGNNKEREISEDCKRKEERLKKDKSI